MSVAVRAGAKLEEFRLAKIREEGNGTGRECKRVQSKRIESEELTQRQQRRKVLGEFRVKMERMRSFASLRMIIQRCVHTK